MCSPTSQKIPLSTVPLLTPEPSPVPQQPLFMTTLNPEAYLSPITTRLTTPCKKTPCFRPYSRGGLKQGVFLQPHNNQPITKHRPAPGFRLSPPRMTSSRCRKGNTASAVIQTTAGNQFPEADFTAHGRFRRMCPAGTQEDDSPDMALRGPCLYPRTAQPHSHKTAHRRTPRALFTSLMARGKICFYIRDYRKKIRIS